MIAQGELAPGTRIHEGRLCEMMSVSRTPLREALKYLASEGLLELVPNRGAIVRKFTQKDVFDMLVVLAALEALAGRLACARASDAEIAEVRAVHDRMVGFYERQDRLNYFNDNQTIHSMIVALADNEHLSAMHRSLQARLKRIRFIGSDDAQKWSAALAEHVEMMEALEARDAEGLAEVLKRHLDLAWHRVKDVV